MSKVSSRFVVTCHLCGVEGGLIQEESHGFIMQPGWWYLYAPGVGCALHCSPNPLTKFTYCPGCTAKRTGEVNARCSCGAAMGLLIGGRSVVVCTSIECEKARRAGIALS